MLRFHWWVATTASGVMDVIAACSISLGKNACHSLSMAMLVQHTCVLHVALVTFADYMVLISRQNNSKLASCSICCRHPLRALTPTSRTATW